MSGELKRADNERALRDLRKTFGGDGGDHTVGLDRAYLLLDEVDELRAEALALKARLDGTTSAIVAVCTTDTVGAEL